MMNTSTSPLRVITLKDGLMVKEVPEVNACQGCMFIADCEECDGMAYDELDGCSIRHTIYQPADPEPTNPEPVGYLWRHASTGRTRLVEPDCVITHRPGWSPVGPLFLGQPETVKCEPLIARHLSEWHEDDGPACWWAWSGDKLGWADEPCWVGTPLDSDWPGHHTHWTPLPAQPDYAQISPQDKGADNA